MLWDLWPRRCGTRNCSLLYRGRIGAVVFHSGWLRLKINLTWFSCGRMSLNGPLGCFHLSVRHARTDCTPDAARLSIQDLRTDKWKHPFTFSSSCLEVCSGKLPSQKHKLPFLSMFWINNLVFVTVSDSATANLSTCPPWVSARHSLTWWSVFAISGSGTTRPDVLRLSLKISTSSSLSTCWFCSTGFLLQQSYQFRPVKSQDHCLRRTNSKSVKPYPEHLNNHSNTNLNYAVII